MRKLWKWIKKAGIISTTNFDAWVHTPRVIAMGLCVIIYCFLQAEGNYREMRVNELYISLTLPEMLFLKLNQGFYTMASLLFLVMVSELPRRISFQDAIILRSSRAQWLFGQILYCCWMVICMVLSMSLLYLVFSQLGGARGFSNTFSETALIEAGQYAEYESLIPHYIRVNMTPWGACILASIPVLFFWLTMVLFFLLLGLIGNQMIGPMIYGFLLFINVTVLMEAMPGTVSTPVNFSTLAAITERSYAGKELQTIKDVIIGYLTACAALLLLLLLIVKKSDLGGFHGNKE